MSLPPVQQLQKEGPSSPADMFTQRGSNKPDGEESRNGRNIAKAFFALKNDTLRFTRIEDDKGALVQNEYVFPNYEIGIVPGREGP